jgi:hypothetical protein
MAVSSGRCTELLSLRNGLLSGLSDIERTHYTTYFRQAKNTTMAANGMLIAATKVMARAMSEANVN